MFERLLIARHPVLLALVVLALAPRHALRHDAVGRRVVDALWPPPAPRPLLWAFPLALDLAAVLKSAQQLVRKLVGPKKQRKESVVKLKQKQVPLLSVKARTLLSQLIAFFMVVVVDVPLPQWRP